MSQMPWLRQTGDRPASDQSGGDDKREGAADDAAPTETAARAWSFAAPGSSQASGAGALAASSRAGDDLGAAATVGEVNRVAGWAGWAGAASEAPPPSGFSLNLATGQNAAGMIQTSGDLADAHWTVSNADNYKNGPTAYTVAPGDADWYNGWFADGPNSTWIAADPDKSDNGKVTYTITFDLTGFDPAAAALVGAQFAVDDQGYVALNGHVLATAPDHAFNAFTAVPSGAGDFVAGLNTITIVTTASDDFLEGARFEGTVVDNTIPVLTISAPTSAAVSQGHATAIGGVSVAASQGHGAGAFTVTVADAGGLLSATGAGVSGSGTNKLTITGSLDQVNSDLATLQDLEGVTGSDTVTVNARDDQGDKAAPVSIALTVDGPVITAPTAVTVASGQPTSVSGVVLSLSGAATQGETYTVTLTDTSGLLAATGAGVSGSGTNSLVISGLLAKVNAALATLTDTAGASGSDTIEISAKDSLGEIAVGVGVAVTANGAPAISAPASLTIGQGHAAPIVGVSLAETGDTSGETFTAVLSDANGLLSATGAGISGSGTTHLTITGSLAQVNADLATLRDTSGTAGADTIDLTASDSLGGEAAPATIGVTTNGPPAVTAPSKLITSQGQETAITGVRLSETGDTTGETFTVTLADAAGLLSATGAGVSGSGTTSLTITGALAQVNAALATLQALEAAPGGDAIIVKAGDSLGGSTGPKTIAVTTDGPLIAAPASAVVSAGRAVAVDGITLSLFGKPTQGETYEVTIEDTGGLLSARGSGVSGSGTDTLVISGLLSQVNAALSTLTDTAGSPGADTIHITAQDSLGETAVPVSVAVTANGTPTISVPASLTLGQGRATHIAGISVAEAGDTAGEIFTTVISDAKGLLSATGSGISGSGTTRLTITGSLDQLNADLATLTDTSGLAGADTIKIAVTDSLGAKAAPGAIAVTTNGTPKIAAPSSVRAPQGEATGLSGIVVSENGDTDGETFTVTLAEVAGQLSATGAGVFGSGTNKLTITGSLDQVNADLATLEEQENAAGRRTIEIGVSDSLGNSAPGKTVTVVTPGPALDVPDKRVSIDLGQATAIPGLGLRLVGGKEQGVTFTVELTDAQGLLSATGDGVSGVGTTDLVLTGTLAQVNAALATVTDTSGAAGRDTIKLSATDSLGGSSGKSIVITVAGGAAGHAERPAGSHVAGSHVAGSHVFVSAMAGLGGWAGEAIHLGQAGAARESALARPHAIA